jgi:hypothetical protein
MNPLILILVAFFIVGCEKKAETKDGANNVQEKPVSFTDSIGFEPDLAVSGLLLFDNTTIESQLGDLMPFVNKNETLPSVHVMNSDRTEYLKLVFHPGSVNNNFAEFEVGLRESAPEKKESLSSRVKTFVTESGISLGSKKDEVIKKKGDDFVADGNKIKYVIDDFEKSAFLKKYNMPVYFAEYEFDMTDTLIRFRFGFEYP